MANRRDTYHLSEPLSQSDARARLSAKDPHLVCEALVAVGLFENDYAFASDVILERGNDRDSQIRGAALIALAHLARRHRRIPPTAFELVRKALRDPDEYIRGQAQAASDDIEQFVREAKATRVLSAAIRQALLEEWDPIGVRGFPEAKDEYDDYVPDVYELLVRGHETRAIVDYLWSLETQHMGLDGNRAATERFAKRPQDIREEIERSLGELP